MNTPPKEMKAAQRSRRILVIDDNPSICEDFRKILCPTPSPARLDSLAATIFGAQAGARDVAPSVRARPSKPPLGDEFVVDAVGQGSAGLEAVHRMMRQRTPYLLAFVDMRMPPGWDGVETCARLWDADPGLQIVICSAYSDYSWHDVVKRLNRPELRLLQKPFASKDVLNLAWTLTAKRR